MLKKVSLTLCVCAAIALGSAHAQTIEAKAYVINEIKVTDAAMYKTYADQVPSTLAPFGGRFVARGGRAELFDGDALGGRIVIVEFPSYDKAKAWHDSPDYQRILATRNAASNSRVYVIEGSLP